MNKYMLDYYDNNRALLYMIKTKIAYYSNKVL